ncbi:3-keto-5-aminohexanoate cleavage protein [Pararhizobium antarcticum]|uniref:3-keto-5-aminohexanoate cleavage protein n=1 Tax=Pararhizobium antarcticum TaxID=1798805 RepID=A0A657LV86_9HYPH|nr:3-keto-5-aminohexanoate cleavage protein [Pararhizobium antarcticum]OJF91652.1 3-keto-5-aminohexanoate cleavage protein [Rhizobium sp. 58]OJF99215.1 3-keto-5-aminohexanoate cleavage protein [Pararhizobium antarcticum]
MTGKIIITCALTGSIHTPTMSPHLPVTPDDITTQALTAASAGAAILHLHARDPETGMPSARAEHFMGFLPRIKQASDAVINISTGGSSQMALEERLAPALAAQPEMCSLNMGSMNFGIFPLADRYDDWKHPWEEPFLRATKDVVFKNTFSDIEHILTTLGKGYGTRFEFECYDAGHIQTVAYYLKQGLIKPPIFIQFVLGILGGIDASPESLTFLKATADRLLGDTFRFSVLAAGRHQMRLATMGAVMGGHVRVGLEDNLTTGAGRALAPDNAHQVSRIRRIIEEMGLEIATPQEAREMLALKGGDRVAF